MEDAKEFKPNFVPLRKSSVSDTPVLRTSGLPTVNNTVITEGVRFGIYTSSGTYTVISPSDGHIRFTTPDGSKINSVHVDLGRGMFPTSGTYDFSCSVRGVASGNILSAHFDVNLVNATGVAQYWTQAVVNSKFQKQLADLYCAPVPFDFRNCGATSLVVNYATESSTIDAYFAIRLTRSSSSENPVTIGEKYDAGAAAQEAANNTKELVYSQNETNGKLDQIIKHISDQLAAMWDQLYNLMAVPWIQNDNQRTNNTISAIEENSENTQTTIEQQTHWHGNFIIEGLKGLFIPSDDYFEGITSDLFDWFEDKFGFLGYTLTYFIRLLNGIMGASQDTVIHFPGIKVPNRATNEVYNILPEQDVDLGAQIGMISEGSFSLLDFLRTAGDIVLVLCFVVMLQNKLHEVESK